MAKWQIWKLQLYLICWVKFLSFYFLSHTESILMIWKKNTPFRFCQKKLLFFRFLLDPKRITENKSICVRLILNKWTLDQLIMKCCIRFCIFKRYIFVLFNLFIFRAKRYKNLIILKAAPTILINTSRSKKDAITNTTMQTSYL